MYHLARMVFSTMDLYSLFINGGVKHIHEEANLIEFGILGFIVFGVLWLYLKYYEIGGLWSAWKQFKSIFTWNIPENDLILGGDIEL